MQFLNMKRVALTVIALLIAGTSAAHADTTYYTVDSNSGNTWRWEIENGASGGDTDELSINDVSMHPSLQDATEDTSDINDDAYDDFGFYYVNGERFYLPLDLNTQLVDNTITYEQDGTIVRLTLTRNYVDYQIYSANGTPSIDGDFGADNSATYAEVLGTLLTTDESTTGDPWILSQTDGTVAYEQGSDVVTVTSSSNELWVRHYIFAHNNDDEVSDETYLENFLTWAFANLSRMDVFTGASSAGSSAAAPAQPDSLAPRTTALVYANANSYADPTGELRALINRIKGLSGSLIGWK